MTIPLSEKLRQAVRSVLGYRSPLYRLAALSLNTTMLWLKGGPAVARQINRLKHTAVPTSDVIQFANLLYPFRVRSHSSDIETVISNFIREEYGQLESDLPPRFIVDAGAYIGDTSAYFLSRFRECTVLAIEPLSENLLVARENLEPYGGRVDLWHAALGSKRGFGRVGGEGTGATLGDAGETVAIVTMAEVVAASPSGFIDILKMDIEGGEVEIFSTDAYKWLPQVRNIILETHGEHAERLVLSTLKAANWKVQRYRNAWYCSA
ncbi:FkbM family methyltransferase [Parasphingorhabdus sp.]|uniref:FkbM family methyltransferase n=1 Tax=Parasphingorhabdus sp. TaxID=2709688 RepID=UPI0032EE341D